jgi:hypothetical protein
VNKISTYVSFLMLGTGKKEDNLRGGNLLGKWSIILSLKLVSIPHSCPRMSDHCDVITPPIEHFKNEKTGDEIDNVSRCLSRFI